MIPLPPPPDAAALLAAWAVEACEAVQVDVHHTGLAPAALVGATGLRWVGDPCRARPALRVEIERLDGITTLSARPSLTLWVRAPVAARDLAPGDEIAVADGIVDQSILRGSPVAGGVAVVALAAGTPLTSAVVAPPVDARAGDAVRIVVRRGALSVSSEGRLLADARVGATARAAADATRRVVVGVLVDPDTVEVR
jgi:flagella basal body P-ring formation protein FlgA